MHNNIMVAGIRDHPPMLATGRYAQWQSCFIRYIDIRPNGDSLRKCILQGPYTPSIVIIPVVPATDNTLAVPERRVSHIKLFDVLKQYQKEVNEICTQRIVKNANPLTIVATAQPYPDPYYQALMCYKSYAPTSKASPPSRSHTTTRYKGKEIAKPITHPSESASKEDNDPKQAQKDKEM
nr:hypothetical protein [Tanacetum cinerariifolium]